MLLFRLTGFATLGCGCLVGRYRDPSHDREPDYVEQKGYRCHLIDHSRDATIVSDALPTSAAAFVTSPTWTYASR